MTMTSGCAQCEKPLTLELGDFEDEYEQDDEDSQMRTHAPNTVPDDVELTCGDHFHWQCLLDSYELEKCPKCSRDITSARVSGSSASAQPRILVNVNNEGGLQQGLDLYPILREESYLRAYPEERKSRAFLEFCSQGDHRAIVDLLKSGGAREVDEEGHNDDDDDGDGDIKVDAMQGSGAQKTADEILRYQDPIGDMQSGLHAAVANGHREVAWLLLLLASEVPEMQFPPLVFQEAAALGIMREDQRGKTDLRSLRDAHGRTAEDVAKEAGVLWNGWVGKGWLAMP